MMERPDFDDCSYEYRFVQDVIDKVGPRLPGSPEEREAAILIKKEMEDACDGAVSLETFTVHPKASIGFIPVLGYLLIFTGIPLGIFIPLVAIMWVGWWIFFALVQVFKYQGWFDFMFPSRQSQNLHGTLQPATRDYGTTIILNGHLDSSWHSPLFARRPHLSKMKIIYGVAGAGGVILICVIKILIHKHWMIYMPTWIDFLFLLLLPGFIFIARYITWDKEKASPGAMDDLMGIAIMLWLARVFKENPDWNPRNSRIILAAFGSEEAGLKGSEAFVKEHRQDLLAGNVHVICVDGISDFDHFHVVTGDAWLGSSYDGKTCDLAGKAMDDAGIKHDFIKTPAGSTDGASFSRAGIKVVTLAAQDPAPASNYHTRNDTLDNIDKRAVVKMKEVVFNLVHEIDGLHG